MQEPRTDHGCGFLFRDIQEAPRALKPRIRAQANRIWDSGRSGGVPAIRLFESIECQILLIHTPKYNRHTGLRNAPVI